MRNLLNTLLQSGIKLCLLTGVAFTFAACYGPAPMPEPYNEPEFRQDQDRVEQQLQQAAGAEEKAQ